MAAHARLVGPFPDGADHEEYDRRRRRVLWKLPTGLYLLGSRAGDRRNLMTCNWVTQVAVEPKLVAVGVETGVHTHALIEEGRVFTLALLAREDRTLVRKFVKPAVDDREARTLNGVPYDDAPVSGAPVPRAAAAFLDCRVERGIDLGSHTLYLGEVLDAGFGDQSEDTDVLRMEDTRMSYGG